MKTARFKTVLAECGRPQLHVPWQKPDRDPQIAKIVRAGRLMTIHQTMRGSGKDYGTVGLHQAEHAQFLIFPRSLRAYADSRIVGIDYGLFAGAEKDSTAKPAAMWLPKRKPRAPKPAPKPALAPKAPERSSPAKASEAPPVKKPTLPEKVAGEIRQVLADLAKGRVDKARGRLGRLV